MQQQTLQLTKTWWSGFRKSLPTTLQGRLDLAFEITWLYGVTLVAFLFNGNNFLFFFTQPKQYMVHFLGITFAVLWIFNFAFSWTPKDKKKSDNSIALWRRPIVWAGKDLSRWLLIFIGIFAVGQIASAIFSQSTVTSILGRDPNDPGYEAYAAISYLLTLTTIAIKLKTKSQLIRLLSVLVAIGTLTSLYGILQFLGWDPFGFGEVLAFNGSRVYSTYGNPIFFGSFIVMTISLTFIWFLLESKSRNVWWIWAIAIASMIIQLGGVWVTGSRGPVLAIFLVGIPVFVIASFFLCQRKDFYKVLGLLGGSAIVLAFGFLILGTIIGEFNQLFEGGLRVVRTIFSFFGTGNVDQFSSGRITIWGGAFELLLSRENWPREDGFIIKVIRHMFGYGQDMFFFTYPLTAEVQSTFAPASHAHSFPLQIWLELGFWGISSFIGIVISTFLIVLNISRKVWQERKLTEQAAWSGIVVSGFWSFLMARAFEQIPGVGRVADLFLFWMLLGVVAAVYRISFEMNNEQEKAQHSNSNYSGNLRQPRHIRRRKKRSSPSINPGGYDLKPILISIASLALVIGLISFVVVDVNAIRGSVVAIKAYNKRECPDIKDKAQYLPLLEQAIQYDPRAEEISLRYVRQLWREINALTPMREASTGQVRENYTSQIDNAYNLATQTLDNHLSEIPYSYNTLLWKRRVLQDYLSWKRLTLGNTHEETLKVEQELSDVLNDMWLFLRSFTSVMQTVASSYFNMGSNYHDKAVEVAEYLVSVEGAGRRERATGYRIIGTKHLLEAQEHNRNGETQLVMESYKLAIENYELALSAGPVSAERPVVNYYYGVSLINTQRHNEAVSYLQEALTGSAQIRNAASRSLGNVYTNREAQVLELMRSVLQSISPSGTFSADDDVLLAKAYQSIIESNEGNANKWESLKVSEAYLHELINFPENTELTTVAVESIKDVEAISDLWQSFNSTPEGVDLTSAILTVSKDLYKREENKVIESFLGKLREINPDGSYVQTDHITLASSYDALLQAIEKDSDRVEALSVAINHINDLMAIPETDLKDFANSILLDLQELEKLFELYQFKQIDAEKHVIINDIVTPPDDVPVEEEETLEKLTDCEY